MDSSSKRVVVNIDDTPASRYTTSRALNRAGFEVREAATGREGLKLVNEKPDLVILDIHLPDINGLELCEKIRSNSHTASIPIIHISATHISNDDQALGLEGGADAYLIHPVSPNVLVATVNAMIRMRKAEQELKKVLAEQTKVVEKLESERGLREQFVSALTHDLRSPLTAARMGAQVLARVNRESADVQKYSSRIISNIDRADRMISDLLNVSRLRAGEKIQLNVVSLNLSELIRETLDDMTTVHGNRFVLECPESIEGYWDSLGLRRTLENLCHNAIKYGSRVESVRVDAAIDGDTVFVSVNNRGNPISAEDQEYLFEPYRRSRSAEESDQKGWGLGLTLVKGFAESHGGTVSVSSSEGRGTIFVVKLPRDSRS